MKLGGLNTQFLVAIVFVALSIYKFQGDEHIQAILFLIMGLGFSTMGIINKGYLSSYTKVLNILSWLFVILAALLFLYAIQSGAM